MYAGRGSSAPESRVSFISAAAHHLHFHAPAEPHGECHETAASLGRSGGDAFECEPGTITEGKLNSQGHRGNPPGAWESRISMATSSVTARAWREGDRLVLPVRACHRVPPDQHRPDCGHDGERPNRTGGNVFGRPSSQGRTASRSTRWRRPTISKEMRVLGQVVARWPTGRPSADGWITLLEMERVGYTVTTRTPRSGIPRARGSYTATCCGPAPT